MRMYGVLAAILLLAAIGAAHGAPTAERVSVRKIWDAAPHNAFTDLIRWKGRWYCVFREGQAHVAPDGALRVLTSRDGETWASAARITAPDADLRDAKITVTPDDRLMLSGAAALHQPAPALHQTRAWFSQDGEHWTGGQDIGDPDMWLWRVAWFKGTAYGVGYSTNPTTQPPFVRLYRSRDGVHFETVVDRLRDQGQPNEHALLFDRDGTCRCLLRRDRGNGLLGTAKPPYMEWKWQDLGVRIGGPTMVRTPDGRIIAGVRRYDGKVRTSLCRIDPDAGTLTEILALPSGGDTSYPGLVWHDRLLWVSYYSSHEGKTSVYLAKVRLPKE